MFDREEQLEQLRAVTFESIREDARLERELRALYYFFYVIMMTGENFNIAVSGCHFSERGPNTMLVVKALVDGVPRVAFVTEKFPIGCVVTFGRQWLEDRVKWHVDKFASI